jgi:hypothetical protein
MQSKLAKLVEIGSPAICGQPPVISEQSRLMAGGLADDLQAFLASKNGFYAFESALHVFAAGPSDETSLEEWNSPSLWRDQYGELDPKCLFFAEDVFGFQFAMCDDEIYSFDPETALLTPVAGNLEGWASVVLDDYDFCTGHSLAHAWQIKNGELPKGVRLHPKRQFVLGGKFELENLGPVNAVHGMCFRGYVAQKIKGLPEGTNVQFVFPD